MDRGQALLAQLRRHLAGWLPVVRRATGARDVALLDGERGAFRLRVVWSEPGREAAYEEEFSRARVFGATYAGPAAGWRVMGRPCDYARGAIRAVLHQRGVL